MQNINTGYYALHNLQMIKDNLIYEPIGSRVMEKVLTLVNEEVYRLLYLECFRHNMLEYSVEGTSNYVIQNLLKNVPVSDLGKYKKKKIHNSKRLEILKFVPQ